MVEAFLYKRKIDWTGASNQEVLENLKSQYDEEISRQNARFRELEDNNRVLNDRFSSTLNEHSRALEALHSAQTGEFKQVVETQLSKVGSLEKTITDRLALQKPVDYWEKKEKQHARASVIFGALACLGAAASFVWLDRPIKWVFLELHSGEDPKHWQLGILAVAAFFSIWFMRVMLRLCFSNIHLATDASERRTMILTYLAMGLEGPDFKPDEKTLILQHLFRAASDGIVKDDAAPPGLPELITRWPR